MVFGDSDALGALKLAIQHVEIAQFTLKGAQFLRFCAQNEPLRGRSWLF